MSNLEHEESRLHVRLDERFRSLAAARGDSAPVFALEHDLDDDERALLHEVVRERSRSFRSRHHRGWLPWVVYAAELGYEFRGKGFWKPLQEFSEDWRGAACREWLRDAFWRFARDYNGARPNGSWARQFSIICWPITHAVVPRDLQARLAKVLYQATSRLTFKDLKSSTRLGELIRAAGARSESERFRVFVQSPALVGQVARALFSSELEAGEILCGEVLALPALLPCP